MVSGKKGATLGQFNTLLTKLRKRGFIVQRTVNGTEITSPRIGSVIKLSGLDIDSRVNTLKRILRKERIRDLRNPARPIGRILRRTRRWLSTLRTRK